MGKYPWGIICIVLEPVDESAKSYKRVGLSLLKVENPSLVFPNGKEVLEIEIV
jgi:hypothetical protein